MKLTKCPMCGSVRMKVLTGVYAVTVNEKRIKIPHVQRQACGSCKEEFFDRESNIALDAYRRARLKHRVAA